MKQFIGHWSLSPALPGRTALMTEQSLSSENGYDYADLESIMSLPVHGAWMNPRGPGHTVQRIADDSAPGMDIDQFCIVEPELCGFALVTAEYADEEAALDHAVFTFTVYGVDSRKPIVTVRSIGRTGLNNQYKAVVGYRPDDDSERHRPILELVCSVGGSLLFAYLGGQ